MNNEQRRALADTIPTTEAIKDAVTFPRDRLGEPLDISPERFDAWLSRVRRDAALALAEHFSAEAIDQARQGKLDGADFNRAVAAEIEKQTPEETP